MPLLTLTRLTLSPTPTPPQHELLLQALQGWGDPEQLTDTEAVKVKLLCAKWFKLNPKSIPFLHARIWKDAVVFSSTKEPGIEHAIILVQDNRTPKDTPILLYQVNRGRRLIPAEHGALPYLKHAVDSEIDE